MVIFWAGIQLTKPTNLPINLTYSFALPNMAFLGGVFGIIISRQWGMFKSAVGKGVFFLSAGLISWGGVGGYLWSYYNFVLHQNIPYPSLSDGGFIAAVVLWAIGIFFLSKATGVQYGLKKKMGRLYLVVFPIVTLALSYYLLVTVARAGSITSGGGLFKVFFDFAYPIGDVVIITIALLVYSLSFKYLGGRFKFPVIIILLGFVAMFFGDFSFSYTTTINTYFNGSYPDLLFTVAMFLMSFGIVSFYTEKT